MRIKKISIYKHYLKDNAIVIQFRNSLLMTSWILVEPLNVGRGIRIYALWFKYNLCLMM